MFVMCIAMFANAFFALNGIHAEISEDSSEDATTFEPLWEEAFKLPLCRFFFQLVSHWSG